MMLVRVVETKQATPAENITVRRDLFCCSHANAFAKDDDVDPWRFSNETLTANMKRQRAVEIDIQHGDYDICLKMGSHRRGLEAAAARALG